VRKKKSTDRHKFYLSYKRALWISIVYGLS
jgi:hypothetical protein